MSVLGIWDELGWDLDFDYEDDRPIRPAEVLTTSTLGGWWSASLELPDLDD